MSRYILTKAVGRFDEDGDNDCDDLTNVYRDNERSDSERFAIFNACRGFNKDMPPHEYQVNRDITLQPLTSDKILCSNDR